MTLSAGAASSSAFKPKRKEMITSGIGALGLAIDVVRKRTLFNQTRIQPKKLTPREEEILGWLGQNARTVRPLRSSWKSAARQSNTI